ncbi:MAG: hypothetical protein AAF609_12240 [Cyanobacteria bacterium P01_C01_bin.120]
MEIAGRRKAVYSGKRRDRFRAIAPILAEAPFLDKFSTLPTPGKMVLAVDSRRVGGQRPPKF